MVPGWVPFKIVSVSAVLYPRWPPLLKIEISSNVQNCSILSQNVPKFEMYKHNDELFKIYYWIFYELWTFDRLRGHKTFFFASLFWKGVKISHIWKLYRIFHSILIICCCCWMDCVFDGMLADFLYLLRYF